MRFVFDKSASRFTVQAFATGMLSAFGHNPTIAIRDYDGEVEFLPETYEKAAVRLNLKTTALQVMDDMKNDDRNKLENSMYQEVLEVDRFPTAQFQSTAITVQRVGGDLLQARVAGELSFHGVTRSQPFDARINDMKTMLRASGEFTVRQSDFAMKPFSFAGGALRLKDELKFKFEMVARQQS